MSQPARHLHAVDPVTGEINCEGCLARDDEIRGLETEKRSWRAKYYAVARDREKEAKRSEWWPTAIQCFEKWQRVCGHPRVAWTALHFWQIEPHLRDPSLGEEMCLKAIDGAGYDPFVNPKARKNGTHKVHDDWSLIFRDPDKVRDFAARAPMTPEVEAADIDLDPRELNRALYAPDGATPYHGPLPADWATA